MGSRHTAFPRASNHSNLMASRLNQQRLDSNLCNNTLATLCRVNLRAFNLCQLSKLNSRAFLDNNKPSVLLRSSKADSQLYNILLLNSNRSQQFRHRQRLLQASRRNRRQSQKAEGPQKEAQKYQT